MHTEVPHGAPPRPPLIAPNHISLRLGAGALALRRAKNIWPIGSEEHPYNLHQLQLDMARAQAA